MGDPPHPPERASPLQHFPGFRRSDVPARGRSSLMRYCAHTKQAPLILNTYLMSPNYRSLNEAATILCTYRGLVVTRYIRLGRSISASQKNPATTRLTFDHQPPTGASCRKRTSK